MSTATKRAETPAARIEPPQDLDAERAVIGAILLDPPCLLLVRDKLQPEDFSRSAHGAIYAAELALADRGIFPDLITLTDELTARGILERVGGASTIARLTNAVPSSAGAPHYADQVREASERRKLLRLAASLTEDATNLASSPAAVASRIASELRKVGESASAERAFKLLPVGLPGDQAAGAQAAWLLRRRRARRSLRRPRIFEDIPCH